MHWCSLLLFCLLNGASTAVEVRTTAELFTALGSIPEWDTIQVQEGTYSGVCGIQIDKALSIQGIGQVELDCQSHDSHFRIGGSATSVELSNIAFVRGYSATNGGCVQVSSGAQVQISGCSFSDCAAADRGGAVFMENSTNVRITDTTFTKCNAGLGGAVSIQGQESVLTMDGCKLLNNTATVGGGILVESASVEVLGATSFLGNIAAQGGGIAGRLLVNSSHVSIVSITGAATFEENFAVSAAPSASAQGGAIYLIDGSSLVSVGAVTFRGNEAHSGGSSGGALYISGRGMARIAGEATITNNFAAIGGAVWAGGAFVELRDGAILSHNTAMLYGGGIYATGMGTSLRLENNVRIDNCFAERAGAIMGFSGVDIQLFNGIEMQSNVATASSGAISLFQHNSLETRGDVHMHDNTAAEDSGAISLHMFNTANLTKGTKIVRNFAGSVGGGLSVFRFSVLHAEGVEFTDNAGTSEAAHSVLLGGAVRCQDGTAHINNCYFARNSAYIGGGLYLKGGGTLTNSRFESNTAQLGGGVAHLSESPLQFNENVLINNSASDSGGCVFSGEASVLHISNSSFSGCSAGNNGAALGIKDDGAVHVSGSVSMRHCTAGGTGGGLHHQGELLRIEPGALLTVQSNSARGGGGISYGGLVTVGGRLHVLDNVALETDGGGLQGSGVLAMASVSEGGWLEVVGNEAAASNGGGVALLDNARLAFDLQSPCPSSCQGLGDGECHPACASHLCRWDAGDCDSRFIDAGSDAMEPCLREDEAGADVCVLAFLQDSSSTCAGACMGASCEWGFGSLPCSTSVTAIGECPYLNAHIYRSVSTTDVRYIKEGGTAGGFGRCESSTCSPADASIGRDEPYCTTINDGGQLIELTCDDCLTTREVGESWGPCAPADKPRLPHVGFDYDPAELLAVLDMDIPGVLRTFPGCGFQPIAIRRNRAALAGGGVYKDGCDGFLESRDRCFVGELENQRLPTIAIDISDNVAGGPGGGFFVECGEMSSCLRALQASPGLPSEPDATDRFLHFGAHSSARAYGPEAAGLPVELRIVAGPSGNLNLTGTAGQTLIDVRYELLDSQGLVVRGSEAWPNPHVVEVDVCRVGAACSAATALQPPFLQRSHPTDAATTTLRSEELLAVCPRDDPRVEVHIKATGSSAPGLHKSVVVACQPCGPGQELVLHGEGDAQMWSCGSCQPTEYVVTPAGGCQPCPLEGAACDGNELRATVAGAEWVAEAAVMRLQSCPAGYILVRDPLLPVLDTCVQCPPGKFSVSAAHYPHTLAVGRASEAPLKCAECARGAECLGGQDIVSLPGFWEDREARSARRAAGTVDVSLYQCSPGACVGNNTCSDGRHGAVCGLCTEGWGRSGIECVECGDEALGKTEHLPSFIVTIACGVVLLYLLTSRPLFEESERALRATLCGYSDADKADTGDTGDSETSPTRWEAVWRHVSSIRWTSPAMIGAFKVAISFYQVASTFHITFRVDWPDSFHLINSLGRLTGLDLSLLLPSVACLSRHYDHLESLLVFTTIFPLSTTLVLCLPYLITRGLGAWRHGGSTQHPKHEAMQRHCLRAVLLWFFLIYPTVSEQTLTTFFCEDLGSGGHVLVLDKSVACPWGGSSPSGGFYFALFLVLLYPIGIPAFFFVVVSLFAVPAMAASKYRRALFAEMLKLFRAETTTPVSVRLAQHVGMAPGTSPDGKTPPSTTAPSSRRASRAANRLRSEASESAVPLQSFKRRVSQLFTQTFVQREMSGIAPASSVHDKLQHVLGQFGCSDEELARLVTVLQRLSISTAVDPELDAFEQLALKIAHNHFLFSGHETLDELSVGQLQALFLFDWEGLNRKRSESEIRKRKARRQRALRGMDEEQLRGWVLSKAKELEKAARITVPTVNWNGETPEEERALGFVGFLFDDFRVQTWWFFLLGECCKLIMTSVLVFVPGRFWQQLAWGFFVQVCVTSLYAIYQPMAEPWLNQFQLYALTVQAAILFFGLCLAVSDTSDLAQQQALYDWGSFIVGLKWTLIAFPAAAALCAKAAGAVQLTVYRLIQGDKSDDPEREPSCLERCLFPSAVATRQSRLRRGSTHSEASLRPSHSLSDADFLGLGLDISAPRRRAPSTVDAQLVSARSEDRLSVHHVSTEHRPPVTTNTLAIETGPPPAPPLTASIGVSSGPDHSDVVVVEAQPAPEHVTSGPVPSGHALSVTAEDAMVSGGLGGPRDGQGPVPVPEQPKLELSVVPTPRN